MRSIEIDFDVYKELTARRKTENVTYNDVLRTLLRMGPIEELEEAPAESKSPLIVQGVRFEHGQRFRAKHKGQTYNAEIDDGFLVYDGKRYTSPSMAGIAVTGYNINGWRFWECYVESENKWIKIDRLRK